MNMLGKWRGYRPSPEHLYLLLTVSLIGLLALGIFLFVAFALVPKIRVRGELIGVVATAEGAVVAAQQTHAAAPAQVQAQVATAQARVSTAAAAFLSETEATAALNHLYQYARESNVTITELKTQPNPQPDGVTVTQIKSFGLQAVGALPQLMNFLARIQETRRSGFLIQNVNMAENETPSTAADSGTAPHLASMSVLLYTSPYAETSASQPITNVITPALTPAPGPLLPTLAAPTGSPTLLPITTPGCFNLINNGDFENDGGWLLGDALNPPLITNNQKYAGQRAIVLGNAPEMGGADRSHASSIRQAVNLPATAAVITLRWWHLYGTGETVLLTPDATSERQEVLLLTAEGQTVATLQQTRRNDGAWQQEAVDLTPYRGQSLYLFFTVVNDGNGLATWMYVDNVQIDACAGEGGVTPVPTALPPLPTPTPSAIAPPTNTPLVVPTPTNTPLVLPTPTNTLLPLPTVAPTPLPTSIAPTPTTPAACGNLLVNGDFEGEGGWLIGPTALQAQYTTSQKHSGARAMGLGSTPERNAGNRNSYSSIRQLVTLPTTASVVTLRWWQLYGSAEAMATDPGTAGDRQEVLLLTGDGRVLAMLQRVRRNDSGWQQTVVDLSAYRGQTVYLYFNVFINNNGAATWAYIDDVQLDTCAGATPAPTATIPTIVAPTLTATLPPTSTPTSTPTLLASPTATPTPTNTLVVIPTITSTSTPSPTPTVFATCTALLVNGDFEADGSWQSDPVSLPPQITTVQKHEGARAMQLGNPPPSSATPQSYSSIRQPVTIPANATTVILRWWSLAGTQEAVVADPGTASDRQEVLLLNQSGQPLAVVQRVRRNDGGWQEAAVDLTPYRGQSIYLYLNVFNDGNGAATWMYVDDIQLNACF